MPGMALRARRRWSEASPGCSTSSARARSRAASISDIRQKVPETYEEKLAQLEELRLEAIHSASEDAVEKQHAKGKLTARERVEALLDPASFRELDTFVRHRTYEFNMLSKRPWGD